MKVRIKAVRRPSQLFSILSCARDINEIEEVLNRLDGKFSVFRFTRADTHGWEVWWRSRKLFYIIVRGSKVTIYYLTRSTDYFPELYGLKINEFKVGS